MSKLLKKFLFDAKPIFNKNNGQINISIPKKKIPKEVKNILSRDKARKFRFTVEELNGKRKG